MSVFGIICEMNPLHLGHKHLLDEARRRGAETIVCVMSGNTVQRGELAVTDAYRRAEALVRCGADLVLELPFPWCSGSAEQFARCGIRILSELCDRVIFGSECGDLTKLEQAARLASDPAFRAAYREALKAGEPAAQAYDRMLREGGVSALQSNDLLGVEYLRAAAEQRSGVRFITVPRVGAAYHEAELAEDTYYPSATGIRALWEGGEYRRAEAYLPSEAAEVFRRAKEEGAMLDEQRLSAALVTFFRLHRGEDFEGIAGAEGGLANRICTMARRARNGRELMELCRTKRYTDGHIRRVMLYCLFGTRAQELAAEPSYTTVLAANERGRSILSARRKGGGLLIVTKLADAPRKTAQYRLYEQVSAFYTAVTERPGEADYLLKQMPYLGERNLSKK